MCKIAWITLSLRFQLTQLNKQPITQLQKENRNANSFKCLRHPPRSQEHTCAYSVLEARTQAVAGKRILQLPPGLPQSTWHKSGTSYKCPWNSSRMSWWKRWKPGKIWKWDSSKIKMTRKHPRLNEVKSCPRKDVTKKQFAKKSISLSINGVHWWNQGAVF